MPDPFVPYARHEIDDDDIRAVLDVLRGDWLTTGPTVELFEQAFAEFVGARHAVAVSNGTAGLHLSILAAGIGAGDEVIVPALTFAASANCARYAGAKVVFADVRPDTLTIDLDHVRSLITPRTRAVVAVDYAGLPCDLDELRTLAAQHGLVVIEDACHALGAEYRGRRVGALSDLSVFSMHPVKHVTTGEGGMITTDDARLADRARMLRSHGIRSDHRQREREGSWRYDMQELGFNYRLPDILCALGMSQLRKLPAWLDRRTAIAARYTTGLAEIPLVQAPATLPDRRHAWHLFAIRLRGDDIAALRQSVFTALRNAGIGANVHYIPVYLHSYYRELGYAPGLCPVAEHAYDGLLSLPMWHGLTDANQSRVLDMLATALLQRAQ
jgi:perosamine synthetase